MSQLERYGNKIAYDGNNVELQSFAKAGYLCRPSPRDGLWNGCPGPYTDPAVAINFFEDFHNLTKDGANGQGWIETAVSVGTGTSAWSASDAMGGVGLMTGAANEDDGAQLQWNCEIFKLLDNKPLWFGARIKISDATQSDFFVGLAITDTTLCAGFSDGVGFKSADASANLLAYTNKDTSNADSTDTTIDLANDTFAVVGFRWDGDGNIYYYVNDKLYATHNTAANICQDEELAPAIGYLAGAAGVDYAYCDWIKCVQLR